MTAPPAGGPPAAAAAPLPPIAAGAQLDVQLNAHLQAINNRLQGIENAMQGIQGALAAMGAAPNVAQRAVIARRVNAHDQEDVYLAVPLANGNLPPHWPPMFNRTVLRGMSGAQLTALLGDYGIVMPGAATVLERRNRLAKHIGTMRF